MDCAHPPISCDFSSPAAFRIYYSAIPWQNKMKILAFQGRNWTAIHGHKTASGNHVHSLFAASGAPSAAFSPSPFRSPFCHVNHLGILHHFPAPEPSVLILHTHIDLLSDDALAFVYSLAGIFQRVLWDDEASNIVLYLLTAVYTTSYFEFFCKPKFEAEHLCTMSATIN